MGVNRNGFTRGAPESPDLRFFRKNYPLTVMQFGKLPQREAWLKRLWELDSEWQRILDSPDASEEILVEGAPPSNILLKQEFDVIYFGGTLACLHGAIMAVRYGRRVLVLEEAGPQSCFDWSLSEEEWEELQACGLFSEAELSAAVLNRHGTALVKFYDGKSRIKTPPLKLSGIADVTLDGGCLIKLVLQKLAVTTQSEVLSGVHLTRCYVEKDRISVETHSVDSSRRQLFGARLLVDASVWSSSLSRQINGRGVTHVRPTVGTVARGFSRGQEADQVDNRTSEMFVSTEDSRDHRQLMWRGFAGAPRRDEYTSLLFFYDSARSAANKSLLPLFERYFSSISTYKRTGNNWSVVRPVFAYLPSSHQHSWNSRNRIASDRVLLINEASGGSSPLTAGSFGRSVRDIGQLTANVDRALKHELLDGSALTDLIARKGNRRMMTGFAEFLRPTPKCEPATVNETLNAFMAALHQLDERVRRELFQDRMSFSTLKSLLSQTAQLYPRIFQRVRERFGAGGTLMWLASNARSALAERREREKEKSSKDQEPISYT